MILIDRIQRPIQINFEKIAGNKTLLQKHVSQLASMQRLLYSYNRYSLLLILWPWMP